MSDQVKQVEHNELIAVRVPPGDKWRIVGPNPNSVQPSLTDALEEYFKLVKFKGDYRISPKEGKIFAIQMVEEVIVPEPEKTYNMYGDPI